MSDIAWIDAALTAARPKAVGALLRYFRDLDIAEEAFQEACLRALRTWPDKGPPRDPAAWLILVGRNSGVDHIRKRGRLQALPDEETISDREDAEADIAERLDASNYRDDILRLLFICCHPDLPATQQIALALRIVSGLSVSEIARAFLVSEAAMEQRITRAKAKVARAGVAFETPDVNARAERLATVSTMVYLVFNEGYSQADPAREAAAFADEAIRLGRLLLGLFPGEPEIMGLLALMLLHASRRAARLDTAGQIVLLEEQNRALWDRSQIDEALVLIEKAIRHGHAGSYQLQAAIAALHARAAARRCKHLQQLWQEGWQRLALTHLGQALPQRQWQVQPALAAQVFLGAVIEHARRAIHDHETIGAVGHLVMRFTSRDERPLQQVQAATAAFHLELQLALQRQHPLRIVVAVQAGGLAVVPQVEDRAHMTSVRVLTFPCNARRAPAMLCSSQFQTQGWQGEQHDPSASAGTGQRLPPGCASPGPNHGAGHRPHRTCAALPGCA